MSVTPICDFVKKYAEAGELRLHMPGHKGSELTGCEKYDITEIEGADVLYASEGIIRKSEEIAAGIFGSGRTVYSTEGSSLAIRAMLYLTKLYAVSKGIKPVVAAGRNAHKTFITAAALSGIEVEWIYGEQTDNLISCSINAESLSSFLGNMAEKPVAVYITSPDYTGNIADVKAISEVCRKNGILLLVDNAHGAYLRFLPEDSHPLTLGADMCCDSAHKTLPVLTGGAYLHISENAPPELAEGAEDAMAVFASTSPSYLILRSLDMANAYMTGPFREELRRLCVQTEKLRHMLMSAGYQLAGNEPTKLTLAPKSYGYTGNELAEILRKNGIVCEFSDPDYTVMMFTPQITDEEIAETGRVLTGIAPKSAITRIPPVPGRNPVHITAREALFLPCERLPVQLCLGRILASPTVSCPPAIPVAVCGEEITENVIECFRYYGIDTCRVVKNHITPDSR